MLAILAAAGAAGLVALVGTAAASSQPAIFLAVGLATFILVAAAGIGLATRRPGSRHRRRLRAGAAALAALLVGVLALTILAPLRDPALPPAGVPGQGVWDLPSGSRIAYVRLAPEQPVRATPVIFLHGGPGTPDMAGDAAYFGQLARDGFEVYVYDEVGSGRSSRLPDPGRYTLERDVQDLEAIRQAIGAPRLILVGHSYGGALAAAYLARHREHVDRVVFSSPMAPHASTDGGNLLGRLTLPERLRVYAVVVPPRPLLAYTLLQVNPRAAHAFAGDRELDARFDRSYNLSRQAVHCRDGGEGPELHGLGFFANQYPQSRAAAPTPDLRPMLAGQGTRALVIKGRCDYLSWSSAQDYLRLLPEARLLYLEGAGHNAYQDQPSEYMAALRAFLAADQLPASSGDAVPADYEGPR